MHFNSYLVECLIFSKFNLFHHVIWKDEYFDFSNFDTFLSPSLNFLATNFSDILNKNSEKKHSCDIPDLGRNGITFSTLSIILAVSFLFVVFIIFSYVSSMPHWWNIFIMKMHWILLIKCSLCICCVDYMAFVLSVCP